MTPGTHIPLLKRGNGQREGEKTKHILTRTRDGGGGKKVEKSENCEKFETIRKGNKCKEIRKSIIEQLKKAGNDKKFYIDLVDDYIDMWVTKQLLVEDIKERGVRVAYDNGGGQKGYKKNDSIEQRLKVNAQMLKILIELKISPSDIEGGDEDELL